MILRRTRGLEQIRFHSGLLYGVFQNRVRKILCGKKDSKVTCTILQPMPRLIAKNFCIWGCPIIRKLNYKIKLLLNYYLIIKLLFSNYLPQVF